MYTGPNLTNDDLVFGYDTGHGVTNVNTATRFCPGKPTTNYLSSGVSNYNVVQGAAWSGATPTFTLGTSEFGTPIGTYTVGSTSYMYSYDQVLDDDLSTLSGQAITFSIYLRRSGGSNVGTVGIRVYDNVSGYTTVYASATYEFQRFTLTKTLGANPTRIFVMIDNTNGGVIDFHSPQLEKGTVSPFVDGTRSATASLIDLKRTRSIDVANVSYDNAAQHVYDGSNDYIVSTALLVEGSQTFETVFTPTANAHSPAAILTNHSYTSPVANFGINYVGGNKLGASIGYTDGTREYDSKLTSGAVWVSGSNIAVHAVLAYNATLNQIKWYINGELDATHSLSKTPNFQSVPVCSGKWVHNYNDYYYDGQIHLGKIYKKELTASEIKSNFKAYKNRFNI